MLAVIVIEARLMQRGAIIDDQQVALLVLVRITKLRLRDLIGQVLQEILGFFGRHPSDRFGLALVKPHGLGAGIRMGSDQGMHRGGFVDSS